MECFYSLYALRDTVYTILTYVLKDAKSVSLYPYIQSQILQYVKYTK